MIEVRQGREARYGSIRNQSKLPKLSQKLILLGNVERQLRIRSSCSSFLVTTPAQADQLQVPAGRDDHHIFRPASRAGNSAIGFRLMVTINEPGVKYTQAEVSECWLNQS